MKPYFETPNGVLYHGDCLEIMATLEPVDLVLTDPLYPDMRGNVKHLNGGVSRHINQSMTAGGYEANLLWVQPVWEKARLGMLVFCSFHFVASLPDLVDGKKVNLFTWYKRNAPNPVCNVPKYNTEFVWAFQRNPGLRWRSLDTSMFDIPNLSAGCVSTGERITNNNGTSAHPFQKPLRLVERLLCVGGQTVLDPFTGSGTVPLACENLGRRWIGIEISEKYCEIAAKRIERERQQLKLFPQKQEIQKPKQEALFWFLDFLFLRE